MLKKSLFCFLGLATFVLSGLLAQQSPGTDEASFYQISDVPIPADIILEVGGLAFDDAGNLGASTRRGEIWMIKNPSSASPEFSRFAHGLHEPLGLAYRNGSFYCAQRGELTKLTDANSDGIADTYENIYNWNLNGNYHEYSYGPLILPDGDMLVNLNLGWVGRGASESKWRGWMLRISEQGQMTPIATGMRSPAGLGFNAAGDIFYTENQGDWVGSGRMTHMEKGDFAGHPEGLKWSGEPGSPISLTMEDIDDTKEISLYEYQKIHDAVKPPSVWFPHTLMGISTSDIAVIPQNFGPFQGQLLVGDQGHSKIMRVFQEKIDGVYQGICFPFVEGFSSGVLRMKWGADQTLFVGMTNRGWASTGKQPYGLQKLKWTGKTPFEMQKVEAQSDGFLISFTEPVDRRSAANPDSYSVTDFTFKYHHLYGSPVTDQEERTIFKVELAQDGMSAKLLVEGMREGYVYEIAADQVKSQQGNLLLHPKGYFTLNVIPDGERLAEHHDHVDANTVFEEVDLKSDKRITVMPGSWLDGPDESLTMGTIPGMKFDQEELTVRAGSKVKLTFNNPDDMMHNLVISSPGSIGSIADAANRIGLGGQKQGYIPKHDEIIAHTNLLRPGSSDIIFFTVPDTPGIYHIVCTFPGHATSMQSTLKVVSRESN